ncbi:MAG: DUF1552 domain-containing protein [Pirellulales bacterium]|nr:DUF1552 domain-containing protein [Pirellulales bacterium]
MKNDAQAQQVSRRRFLGGLGGSLLSLPCLESLAVAAQAEVPAVRMAFFYLPNGLVRQGFFPGESQRALPKATSQNDVWRFVGEAAPVGSHPLTFTPTLDPLQKMKERITLVTGLDRTFQQGTDSHAQAASCFLSSCAPYTELRSAYPIDRTLDHVVGDQIGSTTPFPTLELSCNDAKDNVESIYFDNMSWYGPGHVAPSLRDPRQVYDRLFSTRSHTRYRNITDLVLDNARDLEKQLGVADRHKFGEYYESIRSIEQRMDKIDAMKAEVAEYRTERPGDHLPRNEYIHVMGDLLVTALQAGLTNVGTLMVAPERWQTTNQYEGILDQPRSHHAMSHNQSEFIDDLLKLDHFHVSAFTRLLEKMDSIEEAGGTTLLDNIIFTLGAGLGDGSTHQYNDLPLVVAGGGGGKLKQGRHIQCEQGTPLANLWLAQLHALGMERKHYADSTGTLSSILA